MSSEQTSQQDVPSELCAAKSPVDADPACLSVEFVVAGNSKNIIETLDRAARKGNLPGLRIDRVAGTFSLTDYGKPFESIMQGRVIDEIQSESDGGSKKVRSMIRIKSRIKPTMPVIFVAILIFSVWPGVLLTDSMLKLYFSWYTIPTWWWYIPLTVPFCPIAWRKAWRQSQSSAAAEGRDLIEKIRIVLGNE